MKINRGIGAILFILILAVLCVGLFYGYAIYCEKYYISLYDGEMVRYIDVPPYCTRVDSPINDLKGQCLLEFQTSQDQVNSFLASIAKQRGFIFRTPENAGRVEIEVAPRYIVKGEYSDNRLSLRWTPILTEPLLKKYQRLFPGEAPPSLHSPTHTSKALNH